MTALINLSYLSLSMSLIGFFYAALPVDKKGYYTFDDYEKVKKFDVHTHINTAESYFMEVAKKDNFQFLVIVDDRPFGLPMTQQQYAIQLLKNYAEVMDFATTFSVKDWMRKTGPETTICC